MFDYEEAGRVRTGVGKVESNKLGDFAQRVAAMREAKIVSRRQAAAASARRSLEWNAGTMKRRDKRAAEGLDPSQRWVKPALTVQASSRRMNTRQPASTARSLVTRQMY